MYGVSICKEELTYKPTGMEDLIALIINEDMPEEVVTELKSSFLVKVFNKRIEAFGIEDKIDPMAYTLVVFTNMISAGEVVMYLMDLVYYYDTYGKPATIEDIFSTVYPYGFYTRESLTTIIDIIKEKKENDVTDKYMDMY